MRATSADWHVFTGDAAVVLKRLPDGCVDAIVTDPPYGLSFMGKRWDYDVPSEDIWRECLRVLKPGGHLLAFAGTRTQHRMAVRIEDAGFEIRDMIAWVYGSGFPKSLDVSKAIDKAAGAEREVVGRKGGRYATPKQDFRGGKHHAASDVQSAMFDEITAPATDAARQWAGWGTALKPALEPVTVARKPLAGTVAENVMAHGTGALNIDGARIPTNGETWGGNEANAHSDYSGKVLGKFAKQYAKPSNPSGRWPSNFIHDGSDEVVGLFPQSVARPAKAVVAGGVSGSGLKSQSNTYGGGRLYEARTGYDDSEASAARFFYCAKASKRDRDEGLPAGQRSTHPTVKPTSLMQYLCRLVTPPGGVVLDPFMGSGSTGKAAVLEGFRFIGIERDPEYVAIAKTRIAATCRPAKFRRPV